MLYYFYSKSKKEHNQRLYPKLEDFKYRKQKKKILENQ